ncbi:MAG: T9SS type A sorting domain-containing protein [Bacteroidota bacterium]
MKQLVSFSLLIFSLLVPLAAQPTFSEDIAEIIYNNCTSCHRPGEIGPMAFTNYTQVKAYAQTIKEVTESRYMPPWTPDHTYSSFLDERVLSDQEIQLIGDWVAADAPQGDPALEPPIPDFPSGSVLGTPDLVVPMEQAFVHQGNNKDQYQVFVLPTNLPEDKEIAAIEFRPHNKEIAHHALMALDTSGLARVKDLQDPRYGYESFGSFGVDEAVDLNFGGWVPGVTARNYPSGIGKKLYAGADILLQMHYGPTSLTQSDSSHLNLFFAKDSISRYLETDLISPQDIVGDVFIIPPNQVKTFHATRFVQFDASLINIVPHAHLLGKSWEIFAISPQSDTIKIIKINDWDFNWQGFFSFPSLIKIPAGSTVHFYGTYDNTVNNPSNPHDPPQWMSWGEGTEEEMFVVFLNFVRYRTGDEDIVLSNDWEQELLGHKQVRLFPIYPNPTEREFQIGFQLTRPADVELTVYDLQGRLVQHIVEGKRFMPGHHQVKHTLEGVANGTYLVEIRANGVVASKKLIIQE